MQMGLATRLAAPARMVSHRANRSSSPACSTTADHRCDNKQGNVTFSRTVADHSPYRTLSQASAQKLAGCAGGRAARCPFFGGAKLQGFSATRQARRSAPLDALHGTRLARITADCARRMSGTGRALKRPRSEACAGVPPLHLKRLAI